jgi:hypothetical protein
MSVSQHPLALAIEERVGEGTRLLAVVMCLSLVDGIFPALVLAGALDSSLGVLHVGLLVFGGSATLAVLLAEMDGTRRERLRAVGIVGVLLVVGSVVEAALVPTIGGLLNLARFEWFAALVLLTVAAKTASAGVGAYLPRPSVIIAVGALVSFEPGRAEFALSPDPLVLASAAAAALVAVAFAAGVVLASDALTGWLDLDRFRFGSAVALGVLGLQLVGVVPGTAPLPLVVLGLAALLAFDPDSGEEGGTPTPNYEGEPEWRPEA